MSTPFVSAQSRAKNLLSTTIVLSATTFFARTIVVYYNVYLSSKIGAVGIGTFELIMSVYAFAKTASTAGVSLAATRMSAEEEFFGTTMRRILICCLALGVLCALLLCVFAPFICRQLLHNPSGGIPALQILSLSLPLLSMSSAFGGYFVSRRKMQLYAPVSICEQLIRVALTVILLERFSNHPLGFSISSIALAITLSEAVAFLFSALFYRFISKREEKSAPQSRHRFLRSFLRLALPVGSGALFRASLNTVYNLLVPYGLRRSGASAERSIASYGIVQGMALPIVLYPSALMGVISVQLVPEIAHLHAHQKTKQITYITNRVLRMTLLFSIFCAVILFFFAEELSCCVFQKADAAPLIRALSALVPVMYLDTVTDGILKGLDLQLKVLGIGIVDSFVSLTLIYFLLPPFAMTGYLITIYCGECINTFLGQCALRKKLTVRFNALKDVVFPALWMTAACLTVKRLLFSSVCLHSTAPMVLAIVCALILCLLLCIFTRTIRQEELHWLRTLVFSKKEREEIN